MTSNKLGIIKNILILPIAMILLLGFTTLLSSPSQGIDVSTAMSTNIPSPARPQNKTVNWEVTTTTASPPTTVGPKIIRTAKPRASRSRGSTISGSCGPSSNAYVQPCGCEASSPQSVSTSGKYRGKYQFDQQTWEAHGGSGDPAAASEAEQDRVASNVKYDAWPNC